MADIRLRPGQKEVCDYRGGFLGVPSVPGAGKTFTLAVLTANLIKEERHLPGKILIVTYMNSAVTNFKMRIGDLLEQKGLPRNKGFEVMTLHSLAMKIIKEKPEALLLTDEFIPLDEIEQNRILQRETSQWIEENDAVFKSFIAFNDKDKSFQVKSKIDQWTKKINNVCKEMISYFKCKGIDIHRVPDLLKGLPQHSLLRMTLDVYEKYERYLRHMGMIDFDDLIVKSIDLLKIDDGLRERFQEKYTYIFEDEAQDSSILQEELLRILSEKSGNLARVGDSNQSIMSTFTVSDPKLFKRYCEQKGTQVSKILVSSRNSKDIIDTANYLVEWSQELHPTELCRDSLEPQLISPVGGDDPFPNPRPQGYTIGKILAKTRREELLKIAKNAEKQRDKDKTIAVLIPNGYIMDEIKEIMDQQDIPYREVSSFPKERARATEALGCILDFIAHPDDQEKFIHLLTQYLQEETKEDEELLGLLGSCCLENIFYPADQDTLEREVPREILSSPNWKQLLENIEVLKRFMEASTVEPEALVLHIAESLHFDEEQMAIAQKVALDIQYMIQLNPNWRMAELAAQLKYIRNTYNYFANLVYERNGFTAEPGTINLITYHKSKGLEFDTVYLTCMTSEEFPAKLEDKFRSDYWFLKHDYKNPTAVAKAELDMLMGEAHSLSPIEKARVDTIQERLRLLYVGITRAKENLLFSCHEAYDSDFGRKNVTPSHYFHVLKNYIEEKRSNEGN